MQRVKEKEKEKTFPSDDRVSEEVSKGGRKRWKIGKNENKIKIQNEQ